MKILIVGGGIGGLTLAAFLEGSDVEYEIVEKASDWFHQGFLLGLWDNGRDILKKLHLEEKFDALGSRVQKYSIRDGKGRVLRDYALNEFYANYGTAITLLKRVDLHSLVLQKINPSRLTMSLSVKDIFQTEEGVSVTFTDGQTKKYDLVVGADGVHSQVRSLFFKDVIETYYNWRVWCVWIDNKFDVPASITEYLETRALAIVFRAANKTMAWFVAPTDHALWDKPEGRVQRLQELFKDETFLVPDAFTNVSDEEVLPTDLVELKLKKWTKGRVTLLGDAAHSFGPHAGIGSSMAMEDAYVLAGELMQVGEMQSLSVALANYEKKRKRRIRIAERLSKRLKFWILAKRRFFRKFVDLLIPYVPASYLTNDYNLLLREEI